jgi:hypothetical protein
MDNLKEINTLPHLSFIKINPVFTDFLFIGRTAGNLALDISRRNYNAAIINALTIYTFCLNKDGREIAMGLKPTADNQPGDGVVNNAFAPTDVQKAASKAALEEQTNINGVQEFILKFGTFMANVVQAGNSDEVSAAIEAVALPSGSARIKRESNFNIALNAYVGVFGAFEKMKGVDTGFKANNYGITAPIGIAFSIGNKFTNKNKNSSSFSLFLSILDLGAPTSFRFTDDKTEKVPTIQLRNIVSPGAFISWGLPGVPLSLNAGVQIGPSLRKVTQGTNTIQSGTYTRYSLSLAVDIPLLNFYNKMK